LTRKRSLVSDPRPLDKALFAAGLQCAKRLYLSYHFPDKVPEPNPSQVAMAEAGKQLVLLARDGFPKGTVVEETDFEKAAAATKALLAEKKPCILFDAAFRWQGVDVRTDVAIVSADGSLSIFEVKSGTKVKPRHVMDVALQTLVIESLGYRVLSANLLHVNAQYRHEREGVYSPQQLFKNSDVTERVRRSLPKVKEQLQSFKTLLQDQATVELPTGLWCKEPFPCVYLPHCLAEGPDHPLLELPELTRKQEFGFHEAGVEDVATIDLETTGLTHAQRRAIKSIQADAPVIEEFVKGEVKDLEYPVHFVHVEFLLEVLPRFVGTRPWQQIPYLWSVLTQHEDGRLEHAAHICDEKGDPRPEFVKTLCAHVKGEGLLMLFSNYFEARMRELLEDQLGQAVKSDLRILLNMPYLELQHLVSAGVYAPGFRGEFDLDAVASSLLGPDPAAEAEVDSGQAAMGAYLKLLNPRTRAATRTKLKEDLLAWAKSRSERMHALCQRLAT
jgi:hypothetical protein